MSVITLTNKSSDRILILALVASMLIWGVSWVSGKIIADIAPTKLTTFYRLAMASISMLPILWLAHTFKFLTLHFSYKALVWAVPAGGLLAAYNQLFFLGLHSGLPGKGGMLVTTINPLFTFLLSAICFQQKLKTIQAIGLSFGLVGGLLMIEIWHFDAEQLLVSGNVYFISAALTWAVLTLVSQRAGRYADFLLFSTLMYLCASLISYAFVIEYAPFSSIAKYPSEYWYHMIFLSVVVVSVATSIFFFAAQKLGSNRSSSFVFVVPVSAMSLSAWYFGESLSLAVAMGGGLALSAVYLLNSTK